MPAQTLFDLDKLPAIDLSDYRLISRDHDNTNSQRRGPIPHMIDRAALDKLDQGISLMRVYFKRGISHQTPLANGLVVVVVPTPEQDLESQHAYTTTVVTASNIMEDSASTYAIPARLEDQVLPGYMIMVTQGEN